MKRALFAALFLIALCALVTACSGSPDTTGPGSVADPSGQEEQIPSTGSGITDVGSPVEEPMPPAWDTRCIFQNHQYGFYVVCPGDWWIVDFSETRVSLASETGVDLTLAVVDLAEDETLESFLDQVRGGMDGLAASTVEGFDGVRCAPKELVDPEKGLFTVECYYSRVHQGKRFVLVESGIADGQIVIGVQETINAFSGVLLKSPAVDFPPEITVKRVLSPAFVNRIISR